MQSDSPSTTRRTPAERLGERAEVWGVAVETTLETQGSVLAFGTRGGLLAWAFAQAVLSAIWCREDGFAVDARNPSLLLANAIPL